MELNDCEANVDGVSGVRIRIGGTVYDSNAPEDNDNGIVGAFFQFSHNTNLPAKVDDVHVNKVWKVIEARTDAQNCQTDGMVSVYLEGDVDNIKVRRRQP